MSLSLKETAAALLFGTGLVLAPVAAFAESHTHQGQEAGMVQLGDLMLGNSFTRAMPPGAMAGGGFVTITNNGAEDDVLISASSPAAGVVELHEMKMENDVMVMREKESGIAIPAGATVELKPGGLHIMFMKVGEPFAEGKPVPVSLTFEKAGTVDIMLMVAPIGATEMKH